MATKYYGNAGNNANTGDSVAQAYEDLETAIAATIDDDTLICIDGANDDAGGSNRQVLSDPRTLKAESYQGAYIQSKSTWHDEAFESSLLAAGETVYLSLIHI